MTSNDELIENPRPNLKLLSIVASVLVLSLVCNFFLTFYLRGSWRKISELQQALRNVEVTSESGEVAQIPDVTDLWDYSDTLYWQVHSSAANENSQFINSKYNYKLTIPSGMYLLLHPLSGLNWLRFINTESSIFGDQIGLIAEKYEELNFAEYVNNYYKRVAADGPGCSITGEKINKAEDLVLNNIEVKRIYVSQKVMGCGSLTKSEEVGPIYIFDISTVNNGNKIALVLSNNKSEEDITNEDLKALDEVATSIQLVN